MEEAANADEKDLTVVKGFCQEPKNEPQGFRLDKEGRINIGQITKGSFRIGFLILCIFLYKLQNLCNLDKFI